LIRDFGDNVKRPDAARSGKLTAWQYVGAYAWVSEQDAGEVMFCLLEAPDDYQSYAEEVRRNGWGGCEVGMPGVDCSVCGDTGGLPGRVLPWRLPGPLEQELRKLGHAPIPEDAHKALRLRVEAGLREANPDAAAMPPGADFPPLFWNFKQPPKNNVFWWGPHKAVSARLAERLRAMDLIGFDLIPVDRVRVGVPTPRKDNIKAWADRWQRKRGRDRARDILSFNFGRR